METDKSQNGTLHVGSVRTQPSGSSAFPGSVGTSDVLDRLRTHPAASIRATMDPRPKGPVDYILVHKQPSWLFPVRNDKRTRTGAEYQLHFANFTADIKANGVLQPLIAVSEGEAARVVDGETRRQAALLAGLDSIPILLFQRELSESELVVAQLQSNAQRKDFTPLELASIYAELIRLNGWTQAELARHIHASAPQVAKVLAISTKLCADVQAMVTAGDLAPRAAYALTRLPEQQQVELARRAVSVPMAVESVEEAVAKLLGGSKQGSHKPVKFCVCGVTGTIKGNPLEALKALQGKIAEALKRVERDPALADVLPNLLKSS